MRGLSFGELLDYCAEETNHWREWFRKNPAAADVPGDIAGAKNVREVVLHIAAVQVRYAERLLNLPVTEYDTLRGNTTEELFALAQKSIEDMRSFAVSAKDSDWEATLSFPTRTAGTLTASRRKVFVHALMHGIRHWSQLATFLRQQGFNQDWGHDFIFSGVIK